MAQVTDLFNLVITQAGLSALLQAQVNGQEFPFKSFQFGDVGYAVRDELGNPLPTALDQTALQSPQTSIEFQAGTVVDNKAQLLAVLSAGEPEFDIRELAIIADDGTEEGVLFAVGSHPEAILARRSLLSTVSFSYQFIIEGINPSGIIVKAIGDPLISDFLARIIAAETQSDSLILDIETIQDALNSKAGSDEVNEALAAINQLLDDKVGLETFNTAIQGLQDGLNSKAGADHKHFTTVNTTTSNATPKTILSVPIANNSMIYLEGNGSGYNRSDIDGFPFQIFVGARNVNNVSELLGDPVLIRAHDGPHPNGLNVIADINQDDNELLIRVVGIDGKNIDWTFDHNLKVRN